MKVWKFIVIALFFIIIVLGAKVTASSDIYTVQAYYYDAHSVIDTNGNIWAALDTFNKGNTYRLHIDNNSTTEVTDDIVIAIYEN